MKIILTLLVATLFNFTLVSQELVFNNYRKIEGLINPSYVGHFNGDWQATLLHRQQWFNLENKFTASLANYEKRVQFANESFAVGGYILKQKSGNINFTNYKFGSTIKYAKNIDKHFFALGFQPYLHHAFIDLSANTTPNQYDVEIGRFNPNMNNHENFGNEISTNFDMNFGLNWMCDFGKIEPSLGISFLNIVKSKEPISSIGSKRLTTKVIHGAATYELSNRNFLNPYFHYFNDKVDKNLMLGIDYAFWVESEKSELKSLRAGMQLNTKEYADAIVFSSGVDLTRYSFDISYEHYISGIGAAAGAAIELKVSYKALNTNVHFESTPCNRF